VHSFLRGSRNSADKVYSAHNTKPANYPRVEGSKQFNEGIFPDERTLSSEATHLVPLFVFDEREIELSGFPNYERQGPEARTADYGFWKTGGFRARFISETVYDLRSRLRAVGSDLMVRFGRPEVVVENLAKAFQAQGDEVEGVWLQKEMTSPEIRVEDEIAKRLEPLKVPLCMVHAKMLIHPADLPFDVSDTPDVFTPYRKKVEELGPAMVRPCWSSPDRFKPFPKIPQTPDYSLDVSYEVDVDGLSMSAPESKEKAEGQVSFHDILRYLLKPLDEASVLLAGDSNAKLQQRHPESAFPLRGGESSALERLEWYFIRGKSHDSTRWGKTDPPPVARYKQTRNNLLGHAYSTKMSPFLAYGSISPRQIWEALNYHEDKFGEDQNTYWVRFELLWRDYFFLVAEKFGDLLFSLGGFELATDPEQAKRKIDSGAWKVWSMKDGPEHDVTRLLQGRTGIPFVDANMLELRDSGFMSNRGRQNIASFLTKDLGYSWKIGAEFFQSHLIDYDPTSNYGNWQYVSGVGNDPRASRQFNCIKQAKDYDSHGEYVKTWIPALRNLHPDYVHTPWLLDVEERRSYGLKTTVMDVTIDGYPEQPIFEAESWRKHYNRKEGVGSKMYGNPQEKVKDGRVKRYKKPTPIRGRISVHGDVSPARTYSPANVAPSFLPPGLKRSTAKMSLEDSSSPNWSRKPAASTTKGVSGGFPSLVSSVRGASSTLSTPGGTAPITTPAAGSSWSQWNNSSARKPASVQRGIIGGALGSIAGPSPPLTEVSKADAERTWRRLAPSTTTPPAQNNSSSEGSS
jgi:deoxyribodipyrimidine photo-lyase